MKSTITRADKLIIGLFIFGIFIIAALSGIAVGYQMHLSVWDKQCGCYWNQTQHSMIPFTSGFITFVLVLLGATKKVFT